MLASRGTFRPDDYGRTECALADAIARAKKRGAYRDHDTHRTVERRCLRGGSWTAAGADLRHARAVAVRHGRNGEPRADLGPCLQHPGRDVRHGGCAGRTRRAARLLSWL